MVDIILSCNNGAEIYKLPIPPEEMPEIVKSYNNNTIATSNKVLTVMGAGERKSFTLEFLVPEYPGKYRWARVFEYENAMVYVDWLESVANRRIPLRLIAFNGFDELINIALAIDSIGYVITRQLDVRVSLQVSEFCFT